MIRGDSMFAAFWGGGVAVIDCRSLTDMELVGHITWSPPFAGSTHTAWPIGNRPYLVVTDEARARQKYWDSQFMWIVDIRDETNPLPVSRSSPIGTRISPTGSLRRPQHPRGRSRPGAVGELVFLTYFNAGLRAVDVSDALRPREVGHYVPALPRTERHPIERIGRDEQDACI